ncbi:MAG: sugar ABC transporter permease [Chloroflexota bacterium]|nr:sugar ABC transporter permease [Chloroflexota bacterium]
MRTETASRAAPGQKEGRFRIAGQRRWRTTIDAYILVAPALIVFSIFVVYPLINTVQLSFYQYGLTDPDVRFVNFDNYIRLFQDAIFWRALRNNGIILIFSVVIQVGIGVVLAAVLSRGIRWGKTFFRTLHFAPVVMSAVAVGVLWQLIYDPGIGIINFLLRTVGVRPPVQGWLGDPNIVMFSIIAAACWQYTGYVMTIVLAGMESVPAELYEASGLDGANEVQNFFYITLPMSRNVILAATLITMIGAVKVFDIVYVLTRGGPANASQVLGTYIYYNAFTINQAGYASAIAVVLLVIAVIFGVLQLRFTRQV